jgi:hypothetical protein
MLNFLARKTCVFSLMRSAGLTTRVLYALSNLRIGTALHSSPIELRRQTSNVLVQCSVMPAALDEVGCKAVVNEIGRIGIAREVSYIRRKGNQSRGGSVSLSEVFSGQSCR